ncbi:MAG: RNA-guided endonuclease InsQ/TnpB family protein [Candidatus Thorarchaeota archaeon]
MQRTISLKLVEPPIDELRCTMIVFSEACQYISERIRFGESASIRLLHNRHYRHLRSNFRLPSQMAQSVIRVVVGAYKSRDTNGHTGNFPTFKKSQLQYQYGRDWSFSDTRLSLRTLAGRRKISFETGDFQRKYLDDIKWKAGGARLIERKGIFFLNITLEMEDTEIQLPKTPIGIDRGIRAFAVARVPGKRPLIVKGGELRNYRDKMQRLRKKLQSKGTRSAKKVLVRLRRREKRSVADFCRKTAKAIVEYANTFDSPVFVFENLNYIRSRMKRRGKKNRREANSWAFRLLMEAIRMRAEKVGIAVVTVDPAYTSQTCSRCGSIDKKHRQRDNYRCRHCGYQNNADVVAATNIALRWFGNVYRTKSGVQSITHTNVAKTGQSFKSQTLVCDC